MKYIHIPIKNEDEGIRIAEFVCFGSMTWDDREPGKLKAYPYDTDNPIIIDDEYSAGK